MEQRYNIIRALNFLHRSNKMYTLRAKIPSCITLGAIFIICLAAGCSDRGLNSPQYTPNYRLSNYNINTNLTWSERYWTISVPLDYGRDLPHDDNGIVMSIVNNHYIYHPWQISYLGLNYISGYYYTHDSTYLELTYLYANKLASMGDRIHGGIYIQYSFDYLLHFNNIMVPPWYSGFMQGFALSLFSRTYELTGDVRMKALADSVFTTMLYTDTSSNVWTSMIDGDGYYWIEEYPYHPPEHVFNGFMFGIIGLHDYYLISHDNRCALMIDGACTTVANHFSQWRRPGDICSYCLAHTVQLPNYHLLVTYLLTHMAKISGDSLFNALSDSLYADYH